MQCHEQGWVCLALGHPVLAYLIRNVIPSEARRARFSVAVERRDCFVAFASRNDKQFSLSSIRKSRAHYHCAEWWDNSRYIRRKALRFSALPGSHMNNLIFKLSRVSGAPVSDEELITDLKRVALFLNSNTVPQKKYGSVGTFDYTTVARRFGSWNKALRLAGLSISNECDIPDERLFENILVLWQHLGRQPRRSELSSTPSTISQTPYNRRFGSWTASLEAFVNYANSGSIEALGVQPDVEGNRRTTGRDPSLRLRWHVLQRDRFTCCTCGASPALTSGVELQVDHKIPWSKGGETVLDNLQTLCSKCNLGKSNVHAS